jgi:hypothetical protein
MCNRYFLLGLFLASLAPAKAGLTNVQTVFLIVMENVTWSELKGSTNAPFLNNVLLPMSSYADNFFTAPGTGGSLPQYLWLEAGTNFGINDSADPSAHHLATTNHLVIQLQQAGISWKAYEESITGLTCPTASSGLYAAYHNAFVYFDDIYLNSLNCSNHIRPYPELAQDLTNNTVPRYCFITPNLCDDMHNSSGCTTANRLLNGDNWLASEVPKILSSPAYQHNGALFITWDEGTGGASGPFITLLLSPWAKGGGYRNTNRFDHASTLRTIQEIFGVRPLLYAASTAPNLSDLFKPDLRLLAPRFTNATFGFTVTGVSPGKTNIVQSSTNLSSWLNLQTNVAGTNTFQFTDASASNLTSKYYRVREAP